MPLKIGIKTIGAFKFEVQQLPYFASQRLFMRLLKLAGPGLMGLAQLAGSSGGKAALVVLGNLDTAQIGPVLGQLFERLDPQDAEEITKAILATTRVEVSHATDGLVMRDLLPMMERVLDGDFYSGLAVQAFALSVHFGNFSGARDALAGLGLKVGSPSPGSTISTDGKGETSSSPGGPA